MAFTFPDDKIVVLDGGFLKGTTLEDVFGKDITGALWSASLVDKEPGTIVDAHSAFLNASSDAILTSTYQCAFETFDRAGYSEVDAVNLMRKSVRLAAQAREKYQAPDNAPKCIRVVLSLGPFGATLSPAQEFDGIYPPPYGPRGYTTDGSNINAFENSHDEEAATDALTDFHHKRLRVFIDDEGEDNVWPLIDGLTFETVPLAREILAIRRAMGRLSAYLHERNLASKPWWISTVWPSGLHPQEATPGGAHLTAQHVAYTLFSQSKPNGDGSTDPSRIPVPDGIGINCTHIDDLDAVVRKLRVTVDDIKPISKPFLILYPNGGGVYDVVKHTWSNSKGAQGQNDREHTSNAWAQQLASIAEREQATETWQGLVVGGCCKTGPRHIKLLARALGRTVKE